jgi:hypothetical protein
MSIKKSLLALAAAAMATMAFASSAMATDGVLRDHTGETKPIAENTELHLIGWVKITTNSSSFECHVTAIVKATGTTGTTGDVNTFTVPDTTKCTGTGGLNGCKLKAHDPTTPYHLTVTDNGRVDVTKTGGTIVLHLEYDACLVKKVTLTINEVQLTPKKTGTTPVPPTGTQNTLGATAALGETIAGFEISSGTGVEHVENIFGGKSEETATLSGELELKSPTRCTYEITAT